MRLYQLLATALLLSSCSIFHAAFGFDVTPGSTDCGSVLGVEVWVDNVTTETVQSMTCAQAAKTLVDVRDVGAAKGLWPADQQWPGYRLEFVNAPNLGAIDSLGSDNSWGYTLTWSHRIAVITSQDYEEGKDLPTDLHSSGVILLHEMIHVKEGGNASHCHWASKYSYIWKGMRHEFVETTIDRCERTTCGGSQCWPWPPIPVDTGS